MADPLTTMNVSLPRSMRRYILRSVKGDGFGNSSEYFRHLVREDQARRARLYLQRQLQEGLDSGPATPMTEQDWAELRRRAIETIRLAKKKSA
jgi:antitoxin ParD1/3/4